jgi:hypothetical protein
MYNVEPQDVLLSESYVINFYREICPDVPACTLSGEAMLDVSKIKEITRALELALKSSLIVKITHMEMEVW